MNTPFPRILSLLLALCAACSSTSSRPALSRDAKVLDMPIVKQDSMYDCGLVSVSALCQYWNTTVPESEQVRLSRSAEQNEGLSGAEVCATLDGLGFETFLFRGTLDHQVTGLFHQIDARRPALVMLGSQPDKRHYVLFIGYDEPTKNACLLDPVRGLVQVPYEVFESAWSTCDHFTLVAVPRSSMPVSQTATPETL